MHEEGVHKEELEGESEGGEWEAVREGVREREPEGRVGDGRETRRESAEESLRGVQGEREEGEPERESPREILRWRPQGWEAKRKTGT